MNHTIGIRHFNIRVTGRVQRVFYRASARHHAELLELKGFVRNEDDGSVYMEVEGTQENLKLFVEWCHRGPERAEVEKVDVTESMLKNFRDFKVQRHGW